MVATATVVAAVVAVVAAVVTATAASLWSRAFAWAAVVTALGRRRLSQPSLAPGRSCHGMCLILVAVVFCFPLGRHLTLWLGRHVTSLLRTAPSSLGSSRRSLRPRRHLPLVATATVAVTVVVTVAAIVVVTTDALWSRSFAWGDVATAALLPGIVTARLW